MKRCGPSRKCSSSFILENVVHNFIACLDVHCPRRSLKRFCEFLDFYFIFFEVERKRDEKFMCEIPSIAIFCLSFEWFERRKRMSLVLRGSTSHFVCSWRVRSTCFNKHGVTNRMLFFAPSPTEFHYFTILQATWNAEWSSQQWKWKFRGVIFGLGPVILCGNSKTKRH